MRLTLRGLLHLPILPTPTRLTFYVDSNPFDLFCKPLHAIRQRVDELLTGLGPTLVAKCPRLGRPTLSGLSCITDLIALKAQMTRLDLIKRSIQAPPDQALRRECLKSKKSNSRMFPFLPTGNFHSMALARSTGHSGIRGLASVLGGIVLSGVKT